MAKIKRADQGFAQMTHITILFMALRVQRHAVGLECRYITLSMNRDLKYSKGQLPRGSCNLLSVLIEKEWSVNGQNVVLLMNENFGPCAADEKLYSHLCRPTQRG